MTLKVPEELKLTMIGICLFTSALYMGMDGTDDIIVTYDGHKMAKDGFLWFISMLSFLCVLLFFQFADSKEYPHIFGLIFIIAFFDIIDLIITGNNTWFEIRGYPITMNTYAFLNFAVAIIFEVCRNLIRVIKNYYQ